MIHYADHQQRPIVKGSGSSAAVIIGRGENRVRDFVRVLTRRKPSPDEIRDIEYGRRIANALAALDIGQGVVIAERACVAVEAMEGTDAMLRRAATLVNGRRMALVKVACRREHLLFDVPVVGLATIPVMRETGATVLAVEAGRTLMLDREKMLEAADAAGIAILGQNTLGQDTNVKI